MSHDGLFNLFSCQKFDICIFLPMLSELSVTKLRRIFSFYSGSLQQTYFFNNIKYWSLEAPISSLVVYPLKAWESAGTHARHGPRPCLVPGATPPTLTLWLPPCPPTTTSGSSSSSTSPPNSPSSPQTSGPLPAPTFQPWAAVRFPNLLEVAVAEPDHLSTFAGF